MSHTQGLAHTNGNSTGQIANDHVLTAFLDAVRADPAYELAVALQPEWCDREAHSWAETWNLGVEVEIASFIDVLARQSIEIRSEDTVWSVRFTSDVDGSFVLTRQGPEGAIVKYTAKKDQISALQFDTILWVRLLHPLNQEVKQFVSRSRTLSSIIEELTSLADVDYAFPSDDAEGVNVNHCVRGRSVKECLRIIASVVDWNMTVNGIGNWAAQDADITFSHATAKYRENLQSSGVSDPRRWPSPIDAVEVSLAATAKDLKRERLVVVLTPN